MANAVGNTTGWLVGLRPSQFLSGRSSTKTSFSVSPKRLVQDNASSPSRISRRFSPCRDRMLGGIGCLESLIPWHNVTSEARLVFRISTNMTAFYEGNARDVKQYFGDAKPFTTSKLHGQSFSYLVSCKASNKGVCKESNVQIGASTFGAKPGLSKFSEMEGPIKLMRPFTAICISVRAKVNDEEVLKRQRDRKRIEEALPGFDEPQKDQLKAILELDLESSYDFEEARHYEIIFLIHEACAGEVPAVVKDVKDFISEKKGKIWRLNDWGMRNLAYKIKKTSRANYILMNIEISSKAINDLKSLFDRDQRVIRHLIIKEKKAMTEPTTPPEEYFPTQASDDDQNLSVAEYVYDEQGEPDEPVEEEEEMADEVREDEVEEKEVNNSRDAVAVR